MFAYFHPMTKMCFSLLVLLLPMMGAVGQPPLDKVLFSGLTDKQLEQRDGEWKAYGQAHALDEDQTLAWFLVRFHRYNRPGFAFTAAQVNELTALREQVKNRFPGSFAVSFITERIERNPFFAAQLPAPKTEFQQTLLDMEKAKADVLGGGSFSGTASTVLAAMGAERKEYYANLLKCLNEGDAVIVGGYEDALALWATNMSAGVGRSIEIICAEALLSDAYRTKLGLRHFGHPAATGSPREFVARLLQKMPGHTVISVTVPFELYGSEADRLHIRGLVLSGRPDNQPNAQLWKSFAKTHAVKGKPMAKNYLPMLSALREEPNAATHTDLKEVEKRIKDLQ